MGIERGERACCLNDESGIKESRIQEILSGLTACQEQQYTKQELLPELLELQRQMVNLTFNQEHAEVGDFKLWNIINHFQQMNQDLGGVAQGALDAFTKECKAVNALISSEITGRIGEQKTFAELHKMGIPNRCLHNIELWDGDFRSEIDSLVVTTKGIYIIEVKNTKKNIFIDEKGDCYRTGDFLKWDSNIGKKTRYKRILIEGLLAEAGKKVYPVKAILVFANSRIEVKNQLDSLRVCFLPQLVTLLEEEAGPDIYCEKDIDMIIDTIEASKMQDSYPLKQDMNQFKLDFATLMATLEEEGNQIPPQQLETDSRTTFMVTQLPRTRQHKRTKVLVGIMVATAGVALTSVAVSQKWRK